ncbi:MAG TPA: exosome complex protein Rrp42 [Candidatus Pacearchaeota archaeon]|nr:exosome complex protein Rrp42 [Candidatus Pacearchaeota archaeon]
MAEGIRINEDRIYEYLEKGKRFDERALNDLREIVIETGFSKNAEGSARVKIGKTEVIVGIKIATATPYPDNPKDGNLMVTAELTPLSSSRFESGPPKINAIELGRVIDRGIRESKFIKTEDLCIKEGEKVWEVYIDIYSLNDDGNLMDAAGIGAIAALMNARLPKYDLENDKMISGELSDTHLPLAKELPLSITVYKIGKHLLADPNREEEDVCRSRVTIAGYGDRIFSMQKGGGETFSVEEMKKAIELSIKVREKVFSSIKKYL